DVASSLYAELSPTHRKEESERTEVITLRKVRAHCARNSPVLLRRMNLRLFVCEEVGVSLHRNTEALSQDVVSCSRCFLGSLNVQVIVLVGVRLTEFELSLKPHLRLTIFILSINLVPPDRHVRCYVVTTEDVRKFHFD